VTNELRVTSGNCRLKIKVGMPLCLANISQYFVKLFVHNQKQIFQQCLISEYNFLGAFRKNAKRDY
jgi:hypothetical protein